MFFSTDLNQPPSPERCGDLEIFAEGAQLAPAGKRGSFLEGTVSVLFSSSSRRLMKVSVVYKRRTRGSEGRTSRFEGSTPNRVRVAMVIQMYSRPIHRSIAQCLRLSTLLRNDCCSMFVLQVSTTTGSGGGRTQHAKRHGDRSGRRRKPPKFRALHPASPRLEVRRGC